MAHGIVEIANAAMTGALRRISVQRGYDPRDFVLVGFGGAGPLHANRLADELEIPRTLIPMSPGIFSAMEGIKPGGKTHLAKALKRLAERTEPRSLVILVSDLLDDERSILNGISQLRHRGSEVIVLQVLDPAERELPFNSWRGRRDIEDPSVELRLDARQMAELYRENFAEHQAAIRRGCSAAEVDYLCLETTEPFANTLGRFLHLRSRQK